MWEITSTGQLLNILVGTVFGIMAAAFYYFLFPLFSLWGKRAVINIFDAVFFVICAFLNLILLYCLTNGGLRFYIIIAEAFGFWLFKASLSGIFMKVSSFLFSFIAVLISRLSYFLQRLTEKMLKISLKTAKIIKKLLKKAGKMLYTVFCKEKNGKK